MDIAEEVASVASSQGLRVARLAEVEARNFRALIERTYSPQCPDWPLWETVRFTSAIQDAHAWSWIGEFVGDRESILFFNPADESAMFKVGNGLNLDALLAETFGFEFYVADPGASFLLCFNHHDMLLGAGEAAKWLERRSRGAASSSGSAS